MGNVRIAVVGGGIAGMSVAEALANLGIRVTLVERECLLGGHAAKWACMATDECARCSACLVLANPQGAPTHQGPACETRFQGSD